MWEREALSSYKIAYFVFVILYELPENWNISYASLPLHSGRKNTMQVFGFFRNTNVRQEGPWGGKLTPGKIYFFQLWYWWKSIVGESRRVTESAM